MQLNWYIILQEDILPLTEWNNAGLYNTGFRQFSMMLLFLEYFIRKFFDWAFSELLNKLTLERDLFSSFAVKLEYRTGFID